jgi:hypothetical protein
VHVKTSRPLATQVISADSCYGSQNEASAPKKISTKHATEHQFNASTKLMFDPMLSSHLMLRLGCIPHLHVRFARTELGWLRSCFSINARVLSRFLNHLASRDSHPSTPRWLIFNTDSSVMLSNSPVPAFFGLSSLRREIKFAASYRRPSNYLFRDKLY